MRPMAISAIFELSQAVSLDRHAGRSALQVVNSSEDHIDGRYRMPIDDGGDPWATLVCVGQTQNGLNAAMGLLVTRGRLYPMCNASAWANRAAFRSPR